MSVFVGIGRDWVDRKQNSCDIRESKIKRKEVRASGDGDKKQTGEVGFRDVRRKGMEHGQGVIKTGVGQEKKMKQCPWDRIEKDECTKS